MKIIGELETLADAERYLREEGGLSRSSRGSLQTAIKALRPLESSGYPCPSSSDEEESRRHAAPRRITSCSC